MNREIALCSFLLIRKFIYGVLIIWGFTNGLNAQEDETANPVQNALAKKLLAIDTFQASFSQVVIEEGRDAEIHQSGRVLFDRNGKFLWEVTKPFAQFILVSDDTMQVFDPDLEQLTISSFDRTSSTTFASLILTSSTEVLEQFDIEFEYGIYSLTPKDRGQGFVKLNILFKQDSLSSIEVLDHFNTLNQFRFKDVVTNESISSDEFVIEIPEGTDIVDQRANVEKKNSADDD